MLLGFAGVCGAWFPRGRVSVRFALFSVPSFTAWCVVAPPLGGLVGALVDLLGVLGFSVCFLLLVCWGFFRRVSRGMKSLCARTAPCLFMPIASRVGPQRILCQLATNTINGKAPPKKQLKRRNWGKQLSASFSSVVNLAGNAPSLYARRFKVGSNGPNRGHRVF